MQARKKVMVDTFRQDCFDAINEAKAKYLNSMGDKLKNTKSRPKAYWKILNKLLNKCHVPRIPPIFSNSKLIINGREKAALFNDYFSEQCKPNINDSVLPTISYFTNKRPDTEIFTYDEIKSQILSLNQISLMAKTF